MMKNTTLDTIYSRRSVRSYTGTPVSKDALIEIIKAGMSAPTAVNIQPWAFIAVQQRKVLDELCTRLPYAKMLDKAGAAIVVCGVPDKDDTYARDYWVQDCSAASENILLAVHSMGLGAVWTSVYPDAEKMANARQILDIPENIIPLNVIPVGTPKDEGHVTDKFREENIHWEKW